MFFEGLKLLFETFPCHSNIYGNTVEKSEMIQIFQVSTLKIEKEI